MVSTESSINRPPADPHRGRRRRSQRGGAALEMAMIAPWAFLLFIGALDWGFYAYSLISLQAATRAAVLYTATKNTTAADTDTACTIVLAELSKLPNMHTVCGTNPIVTAVSITGPDAAAASQVTVTYQTMRMIPIPGLLSGQFTITRTAKMRLRT
jgi:Flp pilus assembly protein TadG